ncbi:MAG TPA: hypothetical protein VNA69_16225 [Thermoanaerobaculia bacterium]|nr:hypothetical protein [Thermoanaerobaculia bacterium]
MKGLLLLLVLAFPALAQHDISKVDPAPPDAAIATPMPEGNWLQRRRARKYDIPDLAGAEQALGSQLIDGRLPKPLIDYILREGGIQQRVSIFERGLVVINMTGAASIRKKVFLPQSALDAYTSATTVKALSAIDVRALKEPEETRRSQLRVYEADGTYVERVFHPSAVLPKSLNDQVSPLRDLLRAISEDRGVTSSIAGYEPQPGDELVADDHKIYRVSRVLDQVVELRCLTAPTTIYVAKKDLNLYFIGKHVVEGGRTSRPPGGQDVRPPG